MKTIIKNSNIVARKIHDSFFLIDITDKYMQNTCTLYEINETGMFIWEHIDNSRTADDLAHILHSAIVEEIDFQVILEDVLEFVEILVSRHFVEV